MQKKRRTSPFKKILFTLLTLVLLSAGGVAWFLESAAVPPRQMGPYIERRASGHRFDQLGVLAARKLDDLDRGAGMGDLPPLRIGAQADAVAPARPGQVVMVTTPDAAVKAIEKAHPGDIVTFAPGVYLFSGRPYIATSSAEGVTVRAERAGTVRIELAITEGFLVTSSGWTFENLHIRGACAAQEACDHAFHVVGRGKGFVARNNTITDFNAHFKINGNAGSFPDDGLIENNTISNSSVRATGTAVTPIDLVAASNWTVRGNLITDFIKRGGDRISYGGFFKGGGSGNSFTRNVVICENLLHGARGQRVGLSLGGGGSGPEFCRDKRCLTEQDRGVIEANLIASCSDEGIYLNRSAASTVTHNTLLDTAGMSARWPESTADVHGNIVDGRINARDGALLRASDNLDTGVTRLFTGAHPLRDLYAAPQRLDLRWSEQAPRRDKAGADEKAASDLCGTARPATPAYGAFEDFSACLLK
ncbi:right-handed parallel beta-helix repeat-containing protein [Massilia cavernae]|uniref:Right-handed parallel beta-helix repeat-containing protein n=1 Tax=Massilia cavernae TaxID=2320864 RepID=A0A418XQ43_9BURK|nr:right-handed parallel beta-helix repeat-containing protein [Massilia cavernae]RJG14557.1 right-handed parallel beta-helix repeat-containing protein [Massilia cavernae]